MARRDDLVIANAKIGFKNFSGVEKQYNAAGNRNFVVFLDPEIARKLAQDGWNVKSTRPNEEEGYPGESFIKVNVKYGEYPPKIIRIAGNTKLDMTDETVGSLDREEISNADLVISPYQWEFGGRTGVNAYLKTAYITIREDPFAGKYNFPMDDDDQLPF